MFMFQDRHAGRCRKIKIGNKLFGNVEHFRCLGAKPSKPKFRVSVTVQEYKD